MILCPRCGASNHPSSKFCAACGAQMPAHAGGVQQPGGAAQAGGSHQPAAVAPPPGWGYPAAAAPPGAPSPYGPPPAMVHPGAPAPAGPQAAPVPYGAPPAPAGSGGWGADPYGQAGVAPTGAAGNPAWGQQPMPYPPDARARIGSPEGLNPYGTTMAPDPQRMAPQAAQPPAPHYPAASPQATPYGGAWGDPAALAATAAPYAGAGAAVPTPPPPAQTAAPEAAAAAAPAAAEPASGELPRVLAAFLVSYENNDLGSFWPIFQGRNLVGRAGAAEDLDIAIDHPTTSSHHAIIQATARPGRVELEDLNSTNGTFVNGERVSGEGPSELPDRAEVRFGGFTVLVRTI